MTRRSMVVALLILLGLAALSFALVNKGERALVDFKVFYQAGERFLAGEELYRSADGHWQFKYLPMSAALFAPLAMLPYQAARVIWMLVVAGALVGVVMLSRKLLPKEEGSKWWVVALAILIMLKYYLRELELGQTNAVLALLLLAGLFMIRRQRWTVSGVLFGLAVVVKPYALIFIPYLALKRHSKVWQTALIMIAAALLLPILRYGFSDGYGLFLSWAHSLSGSTPQLLTNPDNISLFGAMAKWFGGEPSTTNLYALGAAVALGGLFLWAVYRPVPVDESGETAWNALFVEASILMVAIPLLSPQGWDYVFLTATPGIMLLVGRVKAFTGYTQIGLVATLAIIGLSIYDLMGRELYRAFMDASILTICFLLVAVFLIFLRFRQPDQSS